MLKRLDHRLWSFSPTSSSELDLRPNHSIIPGFQKKGTGGHFDFDSIQIDFVSKPPLPQEKNIWLALIPPSDYCQQIRSPTDLPSWRLFRGRLLFCILMIASWFLWSIHQFKIFISSTTNLSIIMVLRWIISPNSHTYAFSTNEELW